MRSVSAAPIAYSYDPDDASPVAAAARADADLRMLLDEFENLYTEVLAGARRPHVTEEARERAVARFLYENLPRRPGDPLWPWLGEREELQREVESLEHKVGALTGRLDALRRELAQLKGSRVVKIGRLLSRMAGLRMPY